MQLALAKAARAAGTSVYVLISSGGTSTGSMLPYGRMKAELEVAVKDLGFPRTVILRPGLLVGDRQDSRPAEAVVRTAARFLGAVSGGLLKDFWAQDADVIGRAAVGAGLKALEEEQRGGSPERRVWVLEGAEILKLGKAQ